MITKHLHPLIRLALAILVFQKPSVVVAQDKEAPYGNNVILRGSLANCRIQFEHEKKGNVAFLGGSITEMDGYRPMVCEILQKRFPETKFTFTNAGIGSTCSTTGAFRLPTDVLAKGPVDLLFVEFAVNDDQDAHHTRAECIRGMEGIIRQALSANPKTDIVMTYFVNEGMLQTLQSGNTPPTIEAHAAVAEHYGVSTINLAREAAQEITAGSLTWKQYGGVHPAPPGNRICAKMIDELFSRAWSHALPEEVAATDHALPEQPLDPLHYGSGRFIDFKDAQTSPGWTIGVPDWEKLPGSKRSRFTSLPMLCAPEPGAEGSLEFSGTAVGAYVVAGPDAGMLEASVDGAPPRQVNLYHEFSASLHYPRTMMLATELPAGKHKLTFRVSPETKSSGHAIRIMQFTAN